MTPFHETAPTGPTSALAAEMQAMIPVLRTDRLILRAPRIEDFQVFADIVLGPQGEYYGECTDRGGAWGEFMQLTGTWLLRGHGAWTVTVRDDGAVLGFVHIGAEPGDMEPELGFIVAPDAEGHGIAHEAASAVRDHAFGPFALPALVSYVDAGNGRSRRLAERLGAFRDSQTEAAFDEGVVVYRHPGSAMARHGDRQ